MLFQPQEVRLDMVELEIRNWKLEIRKKLYVLSTAGSLHEYG